MKNSSTSSLFAILAALTAGCTLIAPFDPHSRPDADQAHSDADTAPLDADHSDADSAQDADIDEAEDADIDDGEDADIDDDDDADIDDDEDADIDDDAIEVPGNCIDEDGDGVFAGQDGATIQFVPESPTAGHPLVLFLTASCDLTDPVSKCKDSSETQFAFDLSTTRTAGSVCEYEFTANTVASSEGTYTCVVCADDSGSGGDCEVDPDNANVVACATVDVTPTTE